MNVFIGNDPGGGSGCLTIIYEGKESVRYVHLEYKKFTYQEIAEELRKAHKVWKNYGGVMMACLEQVSAMPGQGVSSTFKFGLNYGWTQGVLDSLGIPYETKTPSKWMGDMNLRKSKGEEKADHKKKRRSYAQKVYPFSGIKNNNQFDSVLLAHYAKEFLTHKHLRYASK